MSVNTSIETVSPILKDVPFKIKKVSGTLKSYKQNTITTYVTEAVTLAKSFGTDSAYDKNLKTHLSITESVTQELSQSFKQGITVGEHYLNNAGSIISDIILFDDVLDDTNFQSSLTPLGFTEFKELRTGDYTYKKALCKIRLVSRGGSGRPNIRGYLHKVDVPDVVEAGVITVTASSMPSVYEFKRKFHIIPEVNFSIKASDETGAEIVITDVSTTTIKVQLKKGTKYIAGQISFSARGY